MGTPAERASSTNATKRRFLALIIVSTISSEAVQLPPGVSKSKTTTLGFSFTACSIRIRNLVAVYRLIDPWIGMRKYVGFSGSFETGLFGVDASSAAVATGKFGKNRPHRQRATETTPFNITTPFLELDTKKLI
jgi:hypothetical protein